MIDANNSGHGVLFQLYVVVPMVLKSQSFRWTIETVVHAFHQHNIIHACCIKLRNACRFVTYRY